MRLLLSIITILLYLQNISFAREYSELVMNSEGQIIHKLNIDAPVHPASLTKLMTLYLTFEALKTNKISMKEELTVSKKAAGQPPSKLWLKTGSKITVKEAILALIVKSANDASVVLSEALANDEWFFTELMNNKAKKLGMHRSYFRNASGLHYSDQITNARDIARMAYLIKKNFPEYFNLFSQTAFRYKGKLYTSHNNVLMDYLPATGMKTGYTKKSGYNLITTATKGKKEVLAVIIGANSSKARDKRMVELLENTLR